MLLRWLLFVLLLAVPGPGMAMTLHDVIQLSREGYSDRQIIKLVQITQSRFQLDAATLITLKEAGVSENVIRELIKSPPPESSSLPPRPPPEEPVAGGPGGGPPAPAPDGPSREILFRTGPFASYPFEETAGRHADSHQHFALALSGLPVFILRSESGYPTIPDRSRDVITRLNRVVRDRPGGSFFGSGDPDAAVWYRPGDSSPAVRILSVRQGDVIAYQRRSLGIVSRDRLAAYWAALLDDFTRLFVFQRPPGELVGLHLGESLNRIYEELGSVAGDGIGASPANPSSVLRAVDHLTREDKEHLLELATQIPAEFGQDDPRRR